MLLLYLFHLLVKFGEASIGLDKLAVITVLHLAEVQVQLDLLINEFFQIQVHLTEKHVVLVDHFVTHLFKGGAGLHQLDALAGRVFSGLVDGVYYFAHVKCVHIRDVLPKALALPLIQAAELVDQVAVEL